MRCSHIRRRFKVLFSIQVWQCVSSEPKSEFRVLGTDRRAEAGDTAGCRVANKMIGSSQAREFELGRPCCAERAKHFKGIGS